MNSIEAGMIGFSHDSKSIEEIEKIKNISVQNIIDFCLWLSKTV